MRSGNTVRLRQSNNTFLSDLTFTVSGNTLQTTNQTIGDATFTVVLTRQ